MTAPANPTTDDEEHCGVDKFGRRWYCDAHRQDKCQADLDAAVADARREAFEECAKYLDEAGRQLAAIGTRLTNVDGLKAGELLVNEARAIRAKAGT